VAFESGSQLLSLQGEVFANCDLLKSVVLPGSITSLEIGGFESCLLPGLIFESPSHLEHMSMVLSGDFDGRDIGIPDSVTILHFALGLTSLRPLVVTFGRESRLRSFTCVTKDLSRHNRYLGFTSPAQFYSYVSGHAEAIPGGRGLLSRVSEPSLKRIRDVIEF
jgi:hypothetical protein